MTGTQEHDITVGSRLSYDGGLCTVRYVGDVGGTTGQWLGVEWDDPERGKHSGEHKGVKYFQCQSKHPTAGSFVRPARAADKPLTFLEAAHEKYVSELTSLNASGDGGAGGSESAGHAPIEFSGKVVEEVGFEKIRKLLAELQELRIVLLDGLRIRGVLAGRAQTPSAHQLELQKIRETCPKITELDMSRNLLQTWTEVTDICLQLSELRLLKLSGNRFYSVEETRRLPGVSQLQLNETLLSWDEIVAIANRLPSLSAISLSSNQLSTVSPGMTDSIKDLTLEHNDFECLESLRDLTSLPNLRMLSLRGNKLDRVYATETTASGDKPHAALAFASSLAFLDISQNNINSWSFLDSLVHVFPGLSSLRVSGNPLYNQPPASSTVTNMPERPMTVDEAYMLTLSRLSQLKILNYSTITRQDRVNAELYYLGLIRTEISLYSSSAEESILRNHPRYRELCEIYDVADLKRKNAEEESSVNPRSLAAQLVTFSFYLKSTAPSPSPNEAPSAIGSSTMEFRREIPRSFDVYRIKAIVARHLSLPALRFRLIWETNEWDPVEQGTAEEDEWDSEDEGREQNKPEQALSDGTGPKFVRREEEFADSTKEVGFWLSDDSRNVRVRIETF